MTTRIICVGNRFAPGDDLGPRVYDLLASGPLPAGVELVEGGLAGLNLLGAMEGAGRVVLVDALSGYGAPGEVVVLEGGEAGRTVTGGYGHSGGLSYLLRMLPGVWEGELPEVLVVGVEGSADEGAVDRVVARCLDLSAGPGGNASRGKINGTSH